MQGWALQLIEAGKKLYFSGILHNFENNNHTLEVDRIGPLIKWNKSYGWKSTKMVIGKKHALKKYDQFALNTSCFWARGSIRSNITSVVQFYEFFVTIIINN